MTEQAQAEQDRIWKLSTRIYKHQVKLERELARQKPNSEGHSCTVAELHTLGTIKNMINDIWLPN